MDEDWGFAYQERIFAAPMFTLVDPDAAVDELEWALDHDARFLLLLPGPVMTPSGGKSPSDPVFDPFWQLINESGVTVVVHGGDSCYSSYLDDWGESAEMEAFRQNPFRSIVSHNATQDYVRQPARPPSLRPLPEPAHGLDRDRLRLGVPPRSRS